MVLGRRGKVALGSRWRVAAARNTQVAEAHTGRARYYFAIPGLAVYRPGNAAWTRSASTPGNGDQLDADPVGGREQLSGAERRADRAGRGLGPSRP